MLTIFSCIIDYTSCSTQLGYKKVHGTSASTVYARTCDLPVALRRITTFLWHFPSKFGTLIAHKQLLILELQTGKTLFMSLLDFRLFCSSAGEYFSKFSCLCWYCSKTIIGIVSVHQAGQLLWTNRSCTCILPSIIKLFYVYYIRCRPSCYTAEAWCHCAWQWRLWRRFCRKARRVRRRTRSTALTTPTTSPSPPVSAVLLNTMFQSWWSERHCAVDSQIEHWCMVETLFGMSFGWWWSGHRPESWRQLVCKRSFS